MKTFAIYDSKAEAYLTPFFQKTAGLAIRAFQQAANDAQHDFSRFAADYTLFEIASYDENTGVITPHKAQINLGLALALQEQQPPPATALKLVDGEQQNWESVDLTRATPRTIAKIKKALEEENETFKSEAT